MHKLFTLLRFVLLLHLSASFSSLFAQTFTGSGGIIPDDGNSINFPIVVIGLPSTIDTLNFGVEKVCIDATHPYVSDLSISLVAPDGTFIVLTSGNGGDQDNYTATCFNQRAETPIAAGTPPYTGTFKPQGQLGLFNNGQNPNGTWMLRILDTYPFADQGSLISCSITFSDTPATAFMLRSSNLPIVTINTHGLNIIDDPKIMADMGIIYNGAGVRNDVDDSLNNYNGKIGIELRGHSSQGFPQKQYGFETRDTSGDDLDVSLLGLPSEHDWILYAPYDDKSLMRNSLTYFLATGMGHYASRSVFCELVLNDEYMGVYVLMEKIKRGKNRVNIDKMNASDTTGDELTGGYLCSIDWADNAGWYSNFPPDQTKPVKDSVFYQYIYPKDDDIVPQQQQYIQQYVDSFETALSASYFQDSASGWRKYADENSFIDFFLINEVSKNVDGYRLSTFFFKDKNSKGGKLQMGPAWDFNLAWRNADYCGNDHFGGWAYRLTDFCEWDFPFWWKRLMEDTQFKNHLRCRYNELRSTVLDTSHIFNYIDSISLYVDEAQQRHFKTWPILGVYTWPNPSPLAQTYREELDLMKVWISERLTFMDFYVPGTCMPLTNGGNELQDTETAIRLFPNPATDRIEVQNYSSYSKMNLQIVNILGQVVYSGLLDGDHAEINIGTLQNGLYYLRCIDHGKLISAKAFAKF
jgi:hypothetical protein